MVVIYSDKTIKGVEGVYISPRYFNGKCEKAKVVYTDDKKIGDAYKKLSIEVKPITKKTRK